MTRSLRPLTACLALAVAVAACSSSTDPPAAGSSLVVGVAGEELRATLERVQVVAKVRGEVAKDATIGRDANGVLKFPAEVTVEGTAGDAVDVELVGYGRPAPGAAEATLLRRLAKTRVPPDKRLLRLQLDSRCLPFAGAEVACGQGLTCVGGRCVSPDVPLSELEPYTPDWPTNAPDPCRPANAGPPELILGKGQTDYSPLQPNELVRLERGPQGGHHLWIAARVRNLRQAGTRTALSAVQPDTGLKATPTAFVFTLDPDEGGYCKIFGLRFQLDAGGDLGSAYKPFLGKPLDVTVEMTDIAGRTARATQRVQIAPKILCPDGTEACNPPS